MRFSLGAMSILPCSKAKVLGRHGLIFFCNQSGNVSLKYSVTLVILSSGETAVSRLHHVFILGQFKHVNGSLMKTHMSLTVKAMPLHITVSNNHS